MLRLARSTLLFFCLNVLIVQPVWAQVTPAPVPAAPSTAATPAPASTPTLYDIRGVIRDAGSHPIRNARVEARGPVTVSTKTDAQGAYDLQVPPGIYSVTVSKDGYEPATQNTLSVINGSVDASVNLVVSVSTNLKTIAEVGAETFAQSRFNTSAAAEQTITPQDFADQGQESLARMLDEIPGISTPSITSWTFGDDLPGQTVTPQMRGAFPYETAQAFDGFPLLSATPGYGFNASMLTTIGLGGIDIIKGPGADSPTVNGAVGGTIDYLSLNPTLKPEWYASSSTDGYGGTLLKIRASGTVGRLGYVAGYSSYNSPGFFSGAYNNGDFVYMDYGLEVNGKAMPCYYIWYCNAYNEGTSVPQSPNSIYDYTASPWIMCCRSAESPDSQFSEYGKLVYQLTPRDNPLDASLDVTYAGSQSNLQTDGFNNYMSVDFIPPPGYTGSLAAGYYNLPAWNGDISSIQQTENILEANLRAKLGPGYFRLGGLAIYQYDNDSDYGDSALGETGGTYTIYGGIPYGAMPTSSNPNPNPEWEIFNGQSAQVSDSENYTQGEYAHGHDWIADYRVPIADNTVDVSWTQSSINPDQGIVYTLAPVNWDDFPAENFNLLKQTNNEFRLSSTLQATPKLSALVSVYYDQYINYLSSEDAPDDIPADPTAIAQYAASFSNHYSYAINPRAALTYRLNEDTSLRFSAGGALVPLPIESLASGGTPPVFDSTNNWWTESVAPVNLKPETSWGYDVGGDVRIPKESIVVSTDLYTTALRNQYMTVTEPDGTYEGAPLYSTQLANLGHARYEGIELAARRTVRKGWGFVLNGFVERGYPYDLPAGFWTNPLTGQPQNLTIIPGENFNNGAGVYGGIGGGSDAIIPYSGGYGEISYNFGKNDSMVRFGAQYYGKYNTFFEPPFFVLSASARYGFTPHVALQVSVDNLGNVYTSPWQGSGSPAFSNLPPVPLYGGGSTYGYYNWVGGGTLTKVELTFH